LARRKGALAKSALGLWGKVGSQQLFRHQARRAKRADLTAERTLEEIRRLMMSDITDYFDDEGHLLNLKELPEDMRACIASVKMKDGEISDQAVAEAEAPCHSPCRHSSSTTG
jgi:hypothetical protein